ncbi:hypothetical protein ACQRDF_10170 [Lachnospiraceae bacterium SGI.054]
MNKSRIDYENLIRNSILFSLDRKNQATAFRREALKMVEYLYLYLNSINSERYKEFGLEITETANRCIKNYRPEAGDFLNYFNAAIAKEYRKAIAKKQLAENHGGVHIPEDDLRIIRKYIKFAETKGAYGFDDATVDAIVAATGITKEKIIECITLYQNSYVTSDAYTTDEGLEGSLFDLIPTNQNEETGILEIEDARNFLEHINEIFKTRQKRQKPLLSMLLTSKMALRLSEDDKLLEFCRNMEFFDEEIYSTSCSRGTPVTAREIASKFRVSEQSVSRSYKMFISLI